MKGQGQKFGTRYPWDKWFGKNRFVLVRGRDFHYRADTMVQHIRSMAKGRGLRVMCTVSDNSDTITVVVVERPGR